MRARNIKPGFFKNEDLAECEPLARILFAGLWGYADREGRFEWRAKRIKAEILPYDECIIDDLLGQLLRKQLILKYSLNGNLYGWIPTFLIHEKPHPRETQSKLPPFDQEYQIDIERDKPRTNLGTTKDIPKQSQGSLNPSSLNPSSLNPGKKIYKRKVPLPKDYKITSEHIIYAQSKGITVRAIEDIFEDFCLYHKKKGSIFVDWFAAWQTWIRKRIEFDKSSPIQKGIEPDQTAVNEAREALAKITPEQYEKNKQFIANLAKKVTKKI